jgi:hypothetical protein
LSAIVLEQATRIAFKLEVEREGLGGNFGGNLDIKMRFRVCVHINRNHLIKFSPFKVLPYASEESKDGGTTTNERQVALNLYFINLLFFYFFDVSFVLRTLLLYLSSKTYRIILILSRRYR